MGASKSSDLESTTTDSSIFLVLSESMSDSENGIATSFTSDVNEPTPNGREDSITSALAPKPKGKTSPLPSSRVASPIASAISSRPGIASSSITMSSTLMSIET